MRNPAFQRVLYVTNASTDRWFVPVNSDVHGGGTPTMAEQVTQCGKMLSVNNASAALGEACQAGSLASW